MPPPSKKSQYARAKILHWLVALIVTLMLMTGWRTSDFSADDKELVILIHSGLGTTVFVLMLYRWWWRKSNTLYSGPGWYKRPSKLIPWFFYPLLLLHPVFGMLQAVFVEYKVLAFGIIDYSAIATANENLSGIFNQLHTLSAVSLILILLFHLIEKSRKFFIDDSNSKKE